MADALTAAPDVITGDPGAVVHEAVGNVPFMLVAVENGTDRMAFGGPVFSHYELEMPGVQRLKDDEWRARLHSGAAPAPPEWTTSWLVPAP